FNKIVSNPGKYHLKYVDKACYDGDFGSFSEEHKNCPYVKTPVRDMGLLPAAYYAQVESPKPWHVCSNPYDYVYWDSLHPTKHMHQLLADVVMKTLRQNDIHRS